MRRGPGWLRDDGKEDEMSEKQRAPDGVLCSAECPMLQQGHCLETGARRTPERPDFNECVPALDEISRVYAKKRVLAQVDVALVAPQTREEIQFVMGDVTDPGLEIFAEEINGLLADGWRRLGRLEVAPCTLGHVLLQPLVRDVPLDVDLGGVDDSEGGEGSDA
jgi:hypothetical protein